MPNIPALVDTTWLATNQQDPGLMVIDATTFLHRPAGDGIRVPEEGGTTYRKGHIPGAVFADLLLEFSDQESDNPFTVLPSGVFAQKAGELGVSNSNHVVIYDQGEDIWATRLWWNLRLEGFDAVSILDGGFAAWQKAGLPVACGVETRPAATFITRRRPNLLADKTSVLAAVEGDGERLINALDPEIFNGMQNTYDRPGHIPNSINVFWQELKSSGRAKPIKELSQLFARAGVANNDSPVITYCGGGIAATYLTFHLAQLGLDNVAVYDGSLTEWTADATLPLNTSTSIDFDSSSRNR